MRAWGNRGVMDSDKQYVLDTEKQLVLAGYELAFTETDVPQFNTGFGAISKYRVESMPCPKK